MKMDRTIRGAAAVGQLTDVPAWEAELILNMRLWQDGPRGQEQVWNAYAAAFGADDGRAELRVFERLLCLIDTHMHRPLVRYGVACRCIGSDEAVFANMVRFAATGDLHEASLVASLLVRPAFAEQIAVQAAQVGTALSELVRTHSTARDGLSNPQIRFH